MRKTWVGALGLISFLATTAVPAAATASGPGSAEKLRRLDIMLMVTSLRCRSGPDNFQADFQAFEARHLAELNAANRQLKADYVCSFGASGADRALDRMSTVMANQYGNGHPWLGCGELKGLARELAETPGEAALLAAADSVLNGDGPQLAYSPGDDRLR